MIEIGLGLLLLAFVVASLSGVGRLLPGAAGFDLLPLLGFAGVSVIVAAAAVLIAAGLARRALCANPAHAHALRTARLAAEASLTMAVLVIGVPFAAGAANLIRIDGMPLGYYAAAQGALIGLVVLAFVWAARQSRIDAEQANGGEPRDE